MASVKILVKGYVSGKDDDNSCCTVSLVRDKDQDGREIVMVVDPGTTKDQQVIVDALKKEGLNINKVNYVCITHSHMDHYRNIGMFPKAKALDYFGVWEGDAVKGWKGDFTNDIRIIKTPGHDRTGITLLVRTAKGVVAVCGDVFWKENYPEDDPYADDMEKLRKSRKMVLEKADLIVPGHDNIYLVEKPKKEQL